MTRQWILSAMCGTLLFSTLTAAPERAGASSTNALPAVIQDSGNKKITVNAGELSLAFDYDDKLILSSMKLGGNETLEPGEVSGSGVLTAANPVTVSASYTNSGDNINHLKDGIISYTENPRNRWTAYRSNKQPVTSDWIEYDFRNNVNVDRLEIYYFEDAGYTAAPQSHSVQYWNGSTFVNVTNPSNNPSAPLGNAANTVSFDKIHTSKIRLNMINKSPGGGKTAYYAAITELEAYDGTTNLTQSQWIGTHLLAASPQATVDGRTVTFNGIIYESGGIPINETWTVEARSSDIVLHVSRTYGGALQLKDQRTLSFAFQSKAFDVVQRTEDGGSFILLDPGVNESGERRSLNRFLSRTPYTTSPSANPEKSNVIRTGSWYDNDRFSFYTANLDLIDKLHRQILSIDLASNRNRATKIWRKPLNETGALVVEHKLSDQAFSLGGTSNAQTGNNDKYLPLGIFQKNDFKTVQVQAGQTDTFTYTFGSEDNLDAYYDIGEIPASSGIDEFTLAEALQDYARSSVIDLNVGMGDTDVSGMGPYETWWYSRNALALQGAGNGAYLDTLKNFVRFIKSYNYPIHGTGQLWAVSARENVWYKDYFFDTYGQFIAGIAAIYDLSADDAWLAEVKDMARKVLDWAAFTRDINNDGLMESFAYQVSQWDDQSKIGQNSAYANAFLYKALLDWAALEQDVLGDQQRADKYRAKAAQLKTTYNKDQSEGGFWSEATKSFVHSRGLNGQIYGDVGHTFENAYVIMFGLVDETRARLILEQYTDFQSGNNLLNQPLALFPAQRTAYSSSENNNPFPSYLHGNSFPQLSYDMMAAYAAIGNNEVPAELLRTLVEQYGKDGLIWNTYTWDLKPDTLREPWMSANARPIAGFYDIIMGIKPKYDRLVIDPSIDASLFGTSVNYELRNHSFTIRHIDDKTRIVDTDGAIPVESVWRMLDNDKSYLVKDENLTDGTVASVLLFPANGQATYTFNAQGQHRLTITEKSAAVSFEDIRGSNASEDRIIADLVLPAVGRNGEMITWQSDNPGAIAPSGTVMRPSFAIGDVPVKLIATIQGGADAYQLNFLLTVVREQNSEASIRSEAYAIDETRRTISNVPSGTRAQDFLAGLTCAENATCALYLSDGTTPVADQTMTSGMKLKVVSQDGRNMRVYTLIVGKKNLALNPSKQGYPNATQSYAYTAFQPDAWKTVDGIISYTDNPHSRWHNYKTTNASVGEEWLKYDFGEVKAVNRVDLYVYAGGGSETPPTFIRTEYWDGNGWTNVPNQTSDPSIPAVALNRVAFDTIQTSQIRVVLGFDPGKIIAVTETEIYGPSEDTALASGAYEIDSTAGTIRGISLDTDVQQFVNRIVAAEGAVFGVYESDGLTPVVQGEIQPGMTVVVTAEGGASQTYSLDVQARPSWVNGTLATANVTSRSALLQWSGASDPSGEIAQYKIFRNGMEAGTVTGAVYSYLADGLSPATVYSFTVEAGNSTGVWSTDGPAITVTTLAEENGNNGNGGNNGNNGNGGNGGNGNGSNNSSNNGVDGNGGNGDMTGTPLATVKVVETDGRAVVLVPQGQTFVDIPFRQASVLPLRVGFGKALLDVERSVMDDLSSGLNWGTDAQLRVSVGPVSGGANEKAPLAAGMAKIRQADRVYDVRLSFTDKDRSVEWQGSGGVHIALPYSASVDEELVGVYYFNEVSGKWEYVGGTVDRNSNLVWAEANRPGNYAVLEVERTFVDIPARHWAARAITVLAAKGIVSGVNDSEFKPRQPTTRAEVAVLLVRALGLKAKGAAKFGDVSGNAWYAADIAAAYESGLIKGVGEDAFAPDALITREQLAVLATRAYEYVTGDYEARSGVSAEFKDAGRIAVWAASSVRKATMIGLMKGRSDGSFSAQTEATRAEAAQIVLNLLEIIRSKIE
ncbi:S-layer homology domain-containing protein [Cohnella sp.]|uniref:S-layer homology domain-containing protein n=1 Tax=Cohnella sp. TaxID=1883426 RepID=UPI0037047806